MNSPVPFTNGHASHPNGLVVSHNGDATPPSTEFNDQDSGPSTQYLSNGYPGPSYQAHSEAIIGHLYNAGFQAGHYADTILNVHQSAYHLHAIILSRSPFLAHLMSTSPPVGQRVIYVPLEHEPEVTQEGFAIALGYLYSPISLSLITPSNALNVLAAGCLLGGMDDLCQYSYDICRRSMSVENIGTWLGFLEAIPTPQSPTDGSPVSELPSHHMNTIFGLYAQRIRDDVFNFLVVTLPEILDIHGVSAADDKPDKNGRDILLQIFSRVPFEMFKAAVESPTFAIGSDQARFKFAKDAIELRKHGIARGPGAEETVVLAFGGKRSVGGSAVHVTRKMRKRPLWKVNA